MRVLVYRLVLAAPMLFCSSILNADIAVAEFNKKLTLMDSWLTAKIELVECVSNDSDEFRDDLSVLVSMKAVVAELLNYDGPVFTGVAKTKKKSLWSRVGEDVAIGKALGKKDPVDYALRELEQDTDVLKIDGSKVNIYTQLPEIEARQYFLRKEELSPLVERLKVLHRDHEPQKMLSKIELSRKPLFTSCRNEQAELHRKVKFPKMKGLYNSFNDEKVH